MVTVVVSPRSSAPSVGVEPVALTDFSNVTDAEIQARGITLVGTPEAFGAVGDGVTDDTAALNRFFALGGGKLGPKTYWVASASALVLQRSGVQIEGVKGVTQIVSGAHYDGSNPATDNQVLFIGTTGTEMLTNITLKGVSFGYTSPQAYRGAKPAVAVQSVDGLTVEDCEFYNGAYGLFLHQVENGDVFRNVFRDTLGDGCQGSNLGAVAGRTLKNIRIIGNQAIRNGDDGIACGSVIPGYSQYSGLQARNITIRGNTIRDQTIQGNGIGLYGADGFDISDNKIYNPKYSGINVVTDTQNHQFGNKNGQIVDNQIYDLDVTPGTASGVSGTHCISLANKNSSAPTDGIEDTGPMLDNVLVARNMGVVKGRGGIWLGMSGRYDVAPYTRYANNVRIIDNEFNFVGDQTTSTDWRGLFAERTRGLVVSGNTFRGFPSIGMLLYSYVGLWCFDNHFINCLGSSFTASDMVNIGGQSAWETITALGRNEYVKSSGTAYRLLHVAQANNAYVALGSDVFNSTGATMSTGADYLYTAGPAPSPGTNIVFSATGFSGNADAGYIGFGAGGDVNNGYRARWHGHDYVGDASHGYFSGNKTTFRKDDGTTVAFELDHTSGLMRFPLLQSASSYANDAAAATGGVAVGQTYRNGSVLQVRVT